MVTGDLLKDKEIPKGKKPQTNKAMNLDYSGSGCTHDTVRRNRSITRSKQ